MEILAPVGNSLRQIRDVIAAGADALYFGVNDHASKNQRYSILWPSFEFDLESGKKAIRIVQNEGRRAYITFNGHITDLQMDSAIDLSCKLVDAGAHAIIASDPGFVFRLKKARPGASIHVSILGNTTNRETASFWKELGASRIILERILSIDEVRAIQERAAIEVEVFVYGNFCFFYYGGCRISHYFFGEMCVAPCFDPYSIEGFPDAPSRPFRSKLLNAYQSLPALYSTGVSAVKIEGREKRREYALFLVRMFRKAIDALERGDPLPPLPPDNLLCRGEPWTTHGYLEQPPCYQDTVANGRGLQKVLFQFVPYLTRRGLRHALYRAKLRRKAFRREDRQPSK